MRLTLTNTTLHELNHAIETWIDAQKNSTILSISIVQFSDSWEASIHYIIKKKP